MIRKCITVSAAFLLCLSSMSLQAQEAVPATGGEASGSGGSSSYTVGQIAYTFHPGTNGNNITEGVQQAYEISQVTGIPEAENISISMSAYPNPASDFLTLSVKDFELYTRPARLLNFQLYDIQGKLLKSKNIITDKTEINTNDLTAGTYFLKVRDNNKMIKSFKIIKNQ